MIRIPNYKDYSQPLRAEEKPPEIKRDSVVICFRDGELVTVPAFAADLDSLEENEKVFGFMYADEDDKSQLIWAGMMFGAHAYGEKMINCIVNEKLSNQDYLNFLDFLGVKYNVISNDEIELHAPVFVNDGPRVYILKGQPWFIGLFEYVQKNLGFLDNLNN